MKLWYKYSFAKISIIAETSKFFNQKGKKFWIDLDRFGYFLIFAVEMQINQCQNINYGKDFRRTY